MKIEIDDVVCLRDTAITIKGARRRITVPIEIVKLMALRDKDKVRWLALKDGTVLLKKINSVLAKAQ
jgi:bifunctional DNA-binding transcriptional regulator/antitoxin component of YhaV-PrlF toxin-antitoxin module